MPAKPTRDFSARLRGARETKGMSQADLAEHAGLQPSAISHFEAGRRSPSFENLRTLADALGVTTDFLLGRSSQSVAAGPDADKMLRQLSRMTAADQQCLLEIAKVLTRRAKSQRQPGVSSSKS